MAQQIQKKFILADAVDEEKILLSNAGSIRMLNSVASEVDLISLNGSDQVTLAGQIALTAADKGVANGVASLDGAGLIPSAQLPSYVDDVLEFANLAAFPVTGETGKIYIAIDTGLAYRWTGSVYAEISSGPADTDALAEGATNLYFTDARATGAVITGFTSGAGTVAATDTILQAIQKLDGNIAAATLTNTDGLAEGVTNLYFTEARVNATQLVGHVALAGTLTDGDQIDVALEKLDGNIAAITSADGSIGTHSDVDLTGLGPATDGYILKYNDTSGNFELQVDSGGPADTDALAEGATNLYFTEARVNATQLTGHVALAGTLTDGDSIAVALEKLDGNIQAIVVPTDTDGLAEGATNLYFTDARATGAVLTGFTSAGAPYTAVAGTDTIQQALEKLDGGVSDHDTRITTLEGNAVNLTWAKERFVLSAGDITNGYIELTQEAAANSIVAFVDRLAIHEGASEDYTVSVPVAVTRMTFVNALVSPGNQELTAGDVINVTYQY
jgi:hypothetical protein